MNPASEPSRTVAINTRLVTFYHAVLFVPGFSLIFIVGWGGSAKQLCHACQVPLPAGAKFCTWCGTPVSEATCPQRKQPLYTGDRFALPAERPLPHN